jgi:phosphoribosylglycinamide formyltransferase 1
MRIGLITYDTHHLKTEQLLAALWVRGQRDMALLGLPFQPRPQRPVRLAHRPDMADGAHPAELAAHYDLPWIPLAHAAAIPLDFDVMLVAGAGLLPAEVVHHVPIVNAHPGLIPTVRGLDSFKWAILDHMPLGNTLHLIDEAVDAGRHLAAVRTPIFCSDTIERLARRHYELEIELLAEFARFLNEPENPPSDLPERPSRKRMPLDLEERMLTGFDAFKACFASGLAPISPQPGLPLHDHPIH